MVLEECCLRPLVDQPAEDAVVCVRNGYKSYGKRVKVLQGVNLNVPRGSIYGLLGPSGCGKTTLLQCIVGKQKLQSGYIRVFDGVPGSYESGVPGIRVGYMPQELALYNEFTIVETLQYFGRIFHMSREQVQNRTAFLIEFLDLPKGKRLIANLSGGQKRRASLATALLHQPDLLILDEPTVGVDPMLRQCIWNHLTEISNSNTTIVITTHYIEEAKQANIVGMMRYGRLLAESSPQALLSFYRMTSLEDVFLHLCDRESKNDNDSGCIDENHSQDDVRLNQVLHEEPLAPNGRSAGHALAEAEKDLLKDHPSSPSHPSPAMCHWDIFRFHRFSALLIKNLIRMIRSWGFLAFQLFIPVVQVAVFCLAIGHDPKGMSLAVFNEELVNLSCDHFSKGCLLGNKDNFMDTFDFDRTHVANLSCRYLSFINQKDIALQFYPDLDSALSSVTSGQNWGVIQFHQNYSALLYKRLFGIMELKLIDDSEMNSSSINIHLDMTNQHVGYTIQKHLIDSYLSFSQDLLQACDISPNLASLPVNFEEPIYGSSRPSFTEFMAPGVILSITYFMAVGLTSISFITERKDGLLDRSWIAGVTATEIMLAHLVAQFLIMMVQVALVLTFMIMVFQVPAKGPIFWVLVLTTLQGICGMSFGLIISALCDNEQDAIQIGLGSFYPNLLLSGIIWPLEGIPTLLRYLSLILPQTYACEALRCLLSRGWGIEWLPVYRGYLVTILWTIIQLTLSAIILRLRR